MPFLLDLAWYTNAMKHVMIAAGGTGGHIYPALALADYLKQEGVRVTFIGSSQRLESTLIPEHGYRLIAMDIETTQGGIVHKIAYLITMLKAIRDTKNLLKQEQPDACIGFGNYISVPLIIAAHQLGIPTMISEQNSYAGKANVFLGRFADAVELAYERSARDFDSKKVRVLGNPQASVSASIQKNLKLLEEYGLDASRPVVTVMMGSLGSASVSKIIDEACARFDDFQVLIAAGKKNPYTFTTENPNVVIRDYVDGAGMLKLSDLAICRAGATTLAEIATAGVPSVLIPSPFVPNNHQYYNALELSEHGAAVLLEEKDLTPELLADTVNKLMNDSEGRKKMQTAAREMGKPNACADTAAWLKELCK